MSDNEPDEVILEDKKDDSEITISINSIDSFDFQNGLLMPEMLFSKLYDFQQVVFSI